MGTDRIDLEAHGDAESACGRASVHSSGCVSDRAGDGHSRDVHDDKLETSSHCGESDREKGSIHHARSDGDHEGSGRSGQIIDINSENAPEKSKRMYGQNVDADEDVARRQHMTESKLLFDALM